MKIKNIKFQEILDSRGIPTVECILETENGIIEKASVPSGKSVGGKEAFEKRENNPKRFFKKGIKGLIPEIESKISKAIIGKSEQEDIDGTLCDLDGSHDKRNLGANFILSVSIASIKAQARENKMQIFEYIRDLYDFERKSYPKLMINVINGGEHADNNINIQEFMIVPLKKNIDENIRIACEIFHKLKKYLKEKGLSTNVGDEGGFAPNFFKTTNVFDALMFSIEDAGYKPGIDVGIALDIAANNLFYKRKYKLEEEYLDDFDYIEKLEVLCANYPIISIEDPLEENDYDNWQKITRKLNIQIVGDDLFVTNKKHLDYGIFKGLGNAILIKPNQIGTITETIETIKHAQKNNYKCVVSHRSGETTDRFISDFAIGVNADYVKFGGITRGERVCKYNRLLEIESFE